MFDEIAKGLSNDATVKTYIARLLAELGLRDDSFRREAGRPLLGC